MTNTRTITVDEDQLASIFWALQDRHNKLLAEVRNKDQHGSMQRINERQYERNLRALSHIERLLNTSN
jgi:hypothetical protein